MFFLNYFFSNFKKLLIFFIKHFFRIWLNIIYYQLILNIILANIISINVIKIGNIKIWKYM